MGKKNYPIYLNDLLLFIEFRDEAKKRNITICDATTEAVKQWLGSKQETPKPLIGRPPKTLSRMSPN